MKLRINESIYEIIYDYTSEEGYEENNNVEQFEGTWADLQDYLKQMRRNGCYNISANEISDYESVRRSKKAISEFYRYSYDNQRISDILDKIEQTNDQRKIDKAYDFINRACDNIDDCMETGFYDLSDASWGYGTDYIIEELTDILNESYKRKNGKVLKESDDKITAKNFQELISKLEDHGYSCGHYYDITRPDSNWLYITKNGDPYEAEFYRYEDGKYELYLHNIHPTRRRNESKTRSKRNKLVEKSNFDTVEKAIRYYYPKWYYDDMSVNDIFDRLEKLGHSQDFIDAVIDGITDKYENEEDYGLDDYDECLTTEDLCLENKYGTLADYLENHLDSWYGRLNEIGEDIEELGLDVDEINDEYIVVHATEPDGEDVYCKIRLGGTERTISLETFEMLESVRRFKNALMKTESVSLKERELVDDKYVLSSKESMNMEDDLRGIYLDDSLDILEDELSGEGFEYYDGGQCILPKDCGYRIWVNGTFKVTIYYGLDDNIVSDIYVKESIK